MKSLITLPQDIQRDWMAQLHQSPSTEKGVFKLVAARRTVPKSFEEQRIIVLVLDENGFPMPNIPIAFSYSPAPFYPLSQDFLWQPPSQLAIVVSTQGSGQIEHIQGSVVKQGQPGGVTVCPIHPLYSSDYVTGCGMLADHTGLHLTFQLHRTGVISIADRLDLLETRISNLELTQFNATQRT